MIARLPSVMSRTMIVCWLAAAIGCYGADGKVVEVFGKQVKASFGAGDVPRQGAVIQIGTEIPGVGFVGVEGRWRVSGVEGAVVTAKPDGNVTGTPAPGMLVRVIQAEDAGEAGETVAEEAGDELPRAQTSAASHKLQPAIANRNAAEVARLLTAGADPDYTEFGGHTMLMEACRVGTPEIVELLLKAGANPSKAVEESKDWESTGKTALMYAAEDGDPAMVKLLLAAGAPANAATHLGVTALHEAAKRGSLESVKALIDAKADVNAVTVSKQGTAGGRSPLHEAASRGHADVVAALLAAKAKPDQAMTQQYAGFTPLRGAAHFGHLAVVNLLLKAGADPNSVCTGNYESAWVGWTPLHAAVYQKHATVVAALVAAGGNPAIADAKGRTPLKLAGKRLELLKALNQAVNQ